MLSATICNLAWPGEGCPSGYACRDHGSRPAYRWLHRKPSAIIRS